jgi:hypothetical protein
MADDRKKGSGVCYLFVGILFVVLIVFVYLGYKKYGSDFFKLTEKQPEPHDIEVEFGPVIFGKVQQEKKLIVMEQDVFITKKLLEEGCIKLPVFKKTEDAVLCGIGTYTVDLSKLDKSCISENKSDKTIVITIPKPELNVTFSSQKSRFLDTKNGLLSWGDLKMSMSEQQELISDAEQSLKDKLLDDPVAIEQSEKYAKSSVKDIYQPIVNKLVDDKLKEDNDAYERPVYYTVQVVFDNSESSDTAQSTETSDQAAESTTSETE